MEYSQKEIVRKRDVLRRSFRIYAANADAFLFFVLLLGGIPQILQSMTGAALFSDFFQWPGWQEVFRAIRYGQFHVIPDILEALVSRAPASNFQTVGFTLLLSFLGLLIGLLITPLVMGGVTNVAAGTMNGVKKTAGQWFASIRPFYGRLVRTGLCYLLVDMAFSVILSTAGSIMGVAFAVGGVLLASMPVGLGLSAFLAPLAFILLMIAVFCVYYAFRGLLYPVAVGEGLYHFRAVSNALKLATHNMGRCLSVLLGTGVLVILWSFVSTLGGVLLVTLGGVPAAVGAGAAALLQTLARPLPLIAFTVLYYDLR